MEKNKKDTNLISALANIEIEELAVEYPCNYIAHM